MSWWGPQRIEIPVHYDLWMQGATTGHITSHLKDGTWLVKMEHWQVRRRVRIPLADQKYCKLL